MSFLAQGVPRKNEGQYKSTETEPKLQITEQRRKYRCKHVHPPVTIISKNLYFAFSQVMICIVFIIDHIRHLINESKMLTFAYNSDRRVYCPISTTYWLYIDI